jgi:hypothetical protein
LEGEKAKKKENFHAAILVWAEINGWLGIEYV